MHIYQYQNDILNRISKKPKEVLRVKLPRQSGATETAVLAALILREQFPSVGIFVPREVLRNLVGHRLKYLADKLDLPTKHCSIHWPRTRMMEPSWEEARGFDHDLAIVDNAQDVTDSAIYQYVTPTVKRRGGVVVKLSTYCFDEIVVSTSEVEAAKREAYHKTQDNWHLDFQKHHLQHLEDMERYGY